ncbi:MAG: peptidase [Lysobacteraceae bacterium]|nr:MAG: peptidase [Xanthomonadaceae bacterium]
MTMINKGFIASALVVFSIGAANAALPDFTELVEESVPAVVNIEARSNGESAIGADQQEVPEFFRRFFEGPGQMPQQPRERVSTGSGFIVSEDGYVMTNHHVVDGADEIIVRLNDRSEFEATVVGSDESSDVALLKVDGDDLPTLPFGDSDLLKPGEWVVAIGSPFNFDYSVTAGIVSAKGRSFSQQQYVPFIQTDVPINRGNSGGPLINMRGEVVGINSQIFSSTGGYMGLSFAIPIEIADSVAKQLRENGRVARGLLGVGIQDVTKELADTLGLEEVEGALVNHVEPGGSADRAGIEVRDVILEFDGTPIPRFSALPPVVGNTPPGTKAPVVVFRDGKRKTIEVEIDELPSDVVAGSTGANSVPEDTSHFGVVVGDMTAEEQRATGQESGVIVRRVVGQSALRAGLRVGDVIVMVDRVNVADLDDYEDAVESLDEDASVALLVKRGNATSFVVIEPE